MSSEAWLCFAGTEIVNQARVYAYAQNGWKPPRVLIEDCGSCGPDIAGALGHDPYSNPGSDKAPWFSTSEPDSLDFGGLYVLGIDGLGPGDVSVDTTARASGKGNFLGQTRQAGPQVVVNGLLIGRSCCGVAYGMRWLRNVLRGSCSSGCGGDDLSYLECCPDWCEDGPDFTGDLGDCMDPDVRVLKGLALSAAPKITDQYGEGCGCGGAAMLAVSFTLVGTEPCAYRLPVPIAEEVGFDLDEPSACHTWIPVASGGVCTAVDQQCATPVAFLGDPLCPTPPAPPGPPAAVNACICTPLATVAACIEIPEDAVPEFADGVPVITVNAGLKPLRQVRMRFFPNPLGLPRDQLDPCSACGEVTLSRVPANAQFVMDGRNRTVTIATPGGGSTDAGSLLGAAGGRLPFSFPEIDCSMRYTMCVEVDAASVDAAAWVSLDLVVREC